MFRRTRRGYVGHIFADGALLLFAADGESLNTILHTVERASGLFGLVLNRTKCVVINMKPILPVMFADGTLITEEENAEYLGVNISNKGKPDTTIDKRIANARWTWRKLAEFWEKQNS